MPYVNSPDYIYTNPAANPRPRQLPGLPMPASAPAPSPLPDMAADQPAPLPPTASPARYAGGPDELFIKALERRLNPPTPSPMGPPAPGTPEAAALMEDDGPKTVKVMVDGKPQDVTFTPSTARRPGIYTTDEKGNWQAIKTYGPSPAQARSNRQKEMEDLAASLPENEAKRLVLEARYKRAGLTPPKERTRDELAGINENARARFMGLVQQGMPADKAEALINANLADLGLQPLAGLRDLAFTPEPKTVDEAITRQFMTSLNRPAQAPTWWNGHRQPGMTGNPLTDSLLRQKFGLKSPEEIAYDRRKKALELQGAENTVAAQAEAARLAGMQARGELTPAQLAAKQEADKKANLERHLQDVAATIKQAREYQLQYKMDAKAAIEMALNDVNPIRAARGQTPLTVADVGTPVIPQMPADTSAAGLQASLQQAGYADLNQLKANVHANFPRWYNDRQGTVSNVASHIPFVRMASNSIPDVDSSGRTTRTLQEIMQNVPPEEMKTFLVERYKMNPATAQALMDRFADN